MEMLITDSLLEEMNIRLVPFSLRYYEDGYWEFVSDLGRYAFSAQDEDLRRLLFRIDARDSDEIPNSKKSIPYHQMIQKAKDRGDYKLFVWKRKHPDNLNEIKELLRK